MGQAVPADLAVPEAADRAAASGPDHQRGTVLASRADQDRARKPRPDQRLGRDIRREPAERHVRGAPEPLPGVIPAAAFIFQWQKGDFRQVLPSAGAGSMPITATKPPWAS